MGANSGATAAACKSIKETTTASTRGTTSASIRATRSTSTKASTAAAKADTEADYVAIKTITISTRARFPAVSAATDMCIDKKKKCTFFGPREKRGRKPHRKDKQKESCDNSNVNIINIAVDDQRCYSSSEPIPDLREGVLCILRPDIVIDKGNLQEDNSLNQERQALLEGSDIISQGFNVFTEDEMRWLLNNI
ncbi:5865_t:CDS:2 [Entrophospora sp. SA101]|nr:9179_t:CDS:2 [Entrophospora sp. SA101]CAJ0748079.1 5865_t:CDS:2 [Entrophospora sp. SA101]